MSKQNITADLVRDLFHYDPDTGIFTRLKTAGAKAKAGMRAGNLNKSRGYRRISIGNKQYLEHRLVWLYVFGIWPEKDIDHINGKRDDNRLANLRDVSRSLNHFNRQHKVGELPLGVWLDKGKYRTQVRINGKPKYLGRFDTKEKAHAAYLAAKRELYGV